MFPTKNISLLSKRTVKTIYKYLMRHCDYFGLVRRLCDKRIPPLIEENPHPPTPLAEAIFKMILRPLNLLTLFIGEDYRETM